MSRRSLALRALAVLTLLGGCSPEQALEKFTNDEEQARAIELIEMMRDGKVEELAPEFAPSLQSPQLRATLGKMSRMMPAGAPQKRSLIGAHININNGVRTSNLTYQYDFGDRWFMVNCAYVNSGPNAGIFGMQIVPLDARLEAKPKFSLRGKSGVHYATLAAAVLAILVTLAALVTCIRDRNLKLKWLWVLFILFGVMQFSLDWNSGGHEFAGYSALLFSASAFGMPYGSWTLSVALPLGAIVYLVRRIWNHSRPPVSNTGNT